MLKALLLFLFIYVGCDSAHKTVAPVPVPAAKEVATHAAADGRPTWIADGFQLINVFRLNLRASLILPAAMGDEPLKYSLEDSGLPDDANPRTLTLPAGLTFNAETRMISGTPTESEPIVNGRSEPWAYRYIVTDKDGDTRSLDFVLGVKSAPEYASLSVAPSLTHLDVTWTPSSDAGVTGYLVQWKSGDQEYSDTERSHTTESTASSYQITNLQPGTKYWVKVTQQGGRNDKDALTRIVITTMPPQFLTVVRGGPAQTYRVRLNKQPPVRVAVYPTKDLADEFAWLRWDSGEKLFVLPALHFFIPDAPTTEEQEESYPPAKWDTYKEFRVRAKANSELGTVTLYHDFIWDDETPRDGFSAGTITVKIIAPQGETMVGGEPGNQEPAGGVGSAVLTGLTVVSVANEPTQLAVSWDAVQGAAKYSVRWKTGAGDYGAGEETTATSYTITDLSAGTTYTVNVAALDGSNTLLAEGTASGTTAQRTGGTGSADPTPAVSFVIYYDPDGGAAAVDRYNQAVALLKEAGISYSEVTGDVRAEVDRLAGVTNSIMPRFFFGDPTAADWVSQPGENNGGLRWLKRKVAELSDD